MKRTVREPGMRRPLRERSAGRAFQMMGRVSAVRRAFAAASAAIVSFVVVVIA